MKYPLVQYVLDNSSTFAEQPLTSVDGLVLSTVAYCYLEDGMLSQTDPAERVPLPLAMSGIPFAALFRKMWVGIFGGPEFVGAVLQSPRFAPLAVSHCVSDFSGDDELQFAAMTFWLPDGTAFVAFRGTDCSVAGWKEDFNLSFMKEIPSQNRARAYLEAIAAERPTRIFVGGHSKGGNLSEFAALTCSVEAYNLVERVYNYDGPAFIFTPSARMDTRSYQEKLVKIVPGSSVVGMLMERRSSYHVVKSTGVLIAQHASTRWVVEDGAFVTQDDLNSDVVALNAALLEFTQISDPQQREIIVEALFGIVQATQIEEWTDLTVDSKEHVKTALRATREMPAELRQVLLDLGKQMHRSSAERRAAEAAAAKAAKAAGPRLWSWHRA